MIRHIVGFKLKDGEAAQRRANAQTIKEQLESLTSLVPSVTSLEVGLEIGEAPPHWDAVLVSEFETRAGLDEYQVHPDHVRVANFIGQFVSDRAIVDYEF